MDATSRNRILMIGGALIVIALLLVCGPLGPQLGGDGSTTGEPPSVAAGPPQPVLDEADEDGVGVAGPGLETDGETGETASAARPQDGTEADETTALATAPSAAAEETGEQEDPAMPGAAGLAAGTAAASGAAAATAGAATAGSGGAAAPSAAAGAPGPAGATGAETPVAAGAPAGAELPPVSAGVPSPPAAPEASEVFDRMLASNALGAASDGSEAGPAGAVSRRFQPPVASGGPAALGIAAAQQFGFDSSLLRPCDTPGSGCQNVIPAPGPPNPPIRPGTRPVPPPNPPVQPGPRPTP